MHRGLRWSIRANKVRNREKVLELLTRFRAKCSLSMSFAAFFFSGVQRTMRVGHFFVRTSRSKHLCAIQQTSHLLNPSFSSGHTRLCSQSAQSSGITTIRVYYNKHLASPHFHNVTSHCCWSLEIKVNRIIYRSRKLKLVDEVSIVTEFAWNPFVLCFHFALDRSG